MTESKRGSKEELDEVTDEVHVMPSYGKEHETTPECWCYPVPDDDVPGVWVHREQN